jgi:hypothetical protein
MTTITETQVIRLIAEMIDGTIYMGEYGPAAVAQAERACKKAGISPSLVEKAISLPVIKDRI